MTYKFLNSSLKTLSVFPSVEQFKFFSLLSWFPLSQPYLTTCIICILQTAIVYHFKIVQFLSILVCSTFVKRFYSYTISNNPKYFSSIYNDNVDKDMEVWRIQREEQILKPETIYNGCHDKDKDALLLLEKSHL